MKDLQRFQMVQMGENPNNQISNTPPKKDHAAYPVSTTSMPYNKFRNK